MGSMYGIFTYIYHKNQPNVAKYTSPMDPMGVGAICQSLPFFFTARNEASRAMWPSSWRLKACPCPRRRRNEGPWRSRCMYLGGSHHLNRSCGVDSHEKNLGGVVDLAYIYLSGWWFQIFFIFTRTPGEMIQFDEHIFQMGWFNHQLDYLYLDDLVLEGWYFTGKNCKGKYAIYMDSMDLIFVSSNLSKRLCLDEAWGQT